MTAQRRVILEELRRAHSHPTASQLYEMVRHRLPRISLGTVYRNLDVLARTGQVLRIGGESSQMRFDGRTHLHCHVRCTECGRIDDIEVDPGGGIDDAVRGKTDYRLAGHTIEFYGLCPQCWSNCRDRIQTGGKTDEPEEQQD